MDPDPLSAFFGQPREYRANQDYTYDVAQLRYHNNRQKDLIRQLVDFELNYPPPPPPAPPVHPPIHIDEIQPQMGGPALHNGTDGVAYAQEGHTGDPLVSNSLPNGVLNTEEGESAGPDQQQVIKETDDKDRSNEPTLDASKSQNDESSEKINRIRTVISKWDNGKSKWRDSDYNSSTKEAKELIGKSATFRRRMQADNERLVESEEIELHSPDLKKLISETDQYWRDTLVDNTQVVILTTFADFVRSWDKYLAACSCEPDDSQERIQAREDLQALLNLIEKSDAMGRYFRSRETILSSKRIKYDFVWTLFGHGTRVYGRPFMGEYQMFEVTSTSAFISRDRRFRISCAAFDWDGSKYQVYEYDFYIEPFSEEKHINLLEVFPTQYYSDANTDRTETQLRAQIIERGHRYISLCAAEPANFQCDYTGEALVSVAALQEVGARRTANSKFPNYGDDDENDINGDMEAVPYNLGRKRQRVIIDNRSFIQSNRNRTPAYAPLGKKFSDVANTCICGTCKDFSTLQRWKHGSDNHGTDFQSTQDDQHKHFGGEEDRLLFLPPRLLGFALEKKFWGQFKVNDLTRTNLTATQDQLDPFWRELQLENDAKDRLMAYVEFHSNSRQQDIANASESIDAESFDIIEDKGRGLVIMLHGPPGVGKTLTAETIARAIVRPLYPITVADVGIDPYEAEERLYEIFTLAQRWQAILLMDEADVFVEARNQSDISRNALVAVLLRCLEYYEGIIILTTNRINSVDMAMQSRIHLAIQYNDLTAAQRIEIYKNRLKQIPDSEIEKRSELEEALVKQKTVVTQRNNRTDGRQIRNIVIGARALAKSRKELLNINHLVEAHSTTADFISSMAELNNLRRGRNEAKIAGDY